MGKNEHFSRQRLCRKQFVTISLFCVDAAVIVVVLVIVVAAFVVLAVAVVAVPLFIQNYAQTRHGRKSYGPMLVFSSLLLSKDISER